jgi:hypothetical protein
LLIVIPLLILWAYYGMPDEVRSYLPTKQWLAEQWWKAIWLFVGMGVIALLVNRRTRRGVGSLLIFLLGSLLLLWILWWAFHALFIPKTVPLSFSGAQGNRSTITMWTEPTPGIDNSLPSGTPPPAESPTIPPVASAPAGKPIVGNPGCYVDVVAKENGITTYYRVGDFGNGRYGVVKSQGYIPVDVSEVKRIESVAVRFTAPVRFPTREQLDQLAKEATPPAPRGSRPSATPPPTEGSGPASELLPVPPLPGMDEEKERFQPSPPDPGTLLIKKDAATEDSEVAEAEADDDIPPPGAEEKSRFPTFDDAE